MKMRVMAILYTVLIGGLLLANLLLMGKQQRFELDMVTLNADYYKVKEALAAGTGRETLEREFDCRILRNTDADYESRVLSEIRNANILFDYTEKGAVLGKIVFNGPEEQLEAEYRLIGQRFLFLCLLLLAGGYLLLFLIYYFYIRPFHKLKDFAAGVAKGELELPLTMQRNNYFGAFTESFDLMREELRRAKENEYRANRSKKELVAELSHDMKTPVATIQATCEVLRLQIERRADGEPNGQQTAGEGEPRGQQTAGAGELNGQQTAGAGEPNGQQAAGAGETNMMLEKIGIIEQKAVMINQLINNLFHASLEELESLKVLPEPGSSLELLAMLEELKYYGELQIDGKPPECLLIYDRIRLRQVIDNLISNAFKYGGTTVRVSFQEEADGFLVSLRDYGQGVKEEELPLITQKYYRGENSRGKNGAGLGLYLSSYFMQHMKGGMECYNDHGFVVRLFLRKAGIETGSTGQEVRIS